MRRRVALTATALLLTLVLAPLAAGGQAPPAPTTRHQYRVAGAPLPAPFDVAQAVVDFAPGAATPLHTHPGETLVTVLEGTVTRVEGTTETAYPTGASWLEPAGMQHWARNATAVKASVIATYLAPAGAPLTTVVAPAPAGAGGQAPPAPTTPHEFRVAGQLPASPFDVAQAVIDFAPGAATPLHTHPGQTLVTVLEGTVIRVEGGTETAYRVGESWLEHPGMAHLARKDAGARASVLASYLAPAGAPLTTVVSAAPGLPNTGAGGAPARALALGLL
ncbi:MAG TPA: cupin domain-containing protein, partial [Vicinamibacteria bacterium]